MNSSRGHEQIADMSPKEQAEHTGRRLISLQKTSYECRLMLAELARSSLYQLSAECMGFKNMEHHLQ